MSDALQARLNSKGNKNKSYEIDPVEFDKKPIKVSGNVTVLS
jgi:hypothetical protein